MKHKFKARKPTQQCRCSTEEEQSYMHFYCQDCKKSFCGWIVGGTDDNRCDDCWVKAAKKIQRESGNHASKTGANK